LLLQFFVKDTQKKGIDRLVLLIKKLSACPDSYLDVEGGFIRYTVFDRLRLTPLFILT
jgi:hypothetical protein